MNLILQWIFVAGCLAWALGYLLYYLGLFARFGWARRRPACACGRSCPLAQDARRRLERMSDTENS